MPTTISAYTASASVSKATAWIFFVVCYLINDEYTVELPLKRGKQRVWVPTANGGASPTPSLSGAKPPSPHLLSLKRKKAKKLSHKKLSTYVEEREELLSKTQKKNLIPAVV